VFATTGMVACPFMEGNVMTMTIVAGQTGSTS